MNVDYLHGFVREICQYFFSRKSLSLSEKVNITRGTVEGNLSCYFGKYDRNPREHFFLFERQERNVDL